MKVAIITDDTVRHLYGSYFPWPIFSFPPGDASKNRQTKEHLEDLLLENGFSTDTLIVGLGGGVVLDLAGFLAATFCRGVPLVLIPTTLVGMVDAAIGGKNGVNTPLGKNKIGTIYHPSQVFIDPRFLKTLPPEEIDNGRVEMKKIFLLKAPEFLQEPSLEAQIWKAIELKRRIVAQDPLGVGLRHLLNLGHTVGHALETLSCYQLSHGKAVAAGIVIESRIALEMGILSQKSFHQIEALFPFPTCDYPPKKVIEVMRRDKKGFSCILLKEIGDPATYNGSYCIQPDLAVVYEVLSDYYLRSCSNKEAATHSI